MASTLHKFDGWCLWTNISWGKDMKGTDESHILSTSWRNKILWNVSGLLETEFETHNFDRKTKSWVISSSTVKTTIRFTDKKFNLSYQEVVAFCHSNIPAANLKNKILSLCLSLCCILFRHVDTAQGCFVAEKSTANLHNYTKSIVYYEG